MRYSDIFVFTDVHQMPGKQTYVKRTQIRKNDGTTRWLTVPSRYSFGDPIYKVRFADSEWPKSHIGILHTTYARCPYFEEVLELLEPLYSEPGESLSEFNQRMIREIANYLGLTCRFEVSSQLQAKGRRDDFHISTAQILGADTYVSGKGGMNYQDPEKFARAGIKLEARCYVPIPYNQIHGKFVGGLSILDALFHLGKRTVDLLEYREEARDNK
jgi:hypothetical protein